MKTAILADIHGNLEALNAVMADLASRKIDRLVSLGDHVGYGPDPDGVTGLLRKLEFLPVLGNHEFALVDSRARKWLNFLAAENSLSTKNMMSPANLKFSAELPVSLHLGESFFVHGFPPASVFRYLDRQADERIRKLFSASDARLFFVGHTHRLQLVREKEGAIVRDPLQEGIVRLAEGKKYIVNAGSVGQPRDGDFRANYLVWDDDSGELALVRVDYDCAVTKQKIRALGFPEIYAARLGKKER